ncbi:MAG: PD-(D/E)XK nuclease family transposase [Clostridia bacterium]|nr:PD-(D/E)XK nuclease family transposase [Clostridia bacterium]
MREDEYSTIILTTKFELHIIELKKLEVNIKQQGNEKLEQWLGFIKNLELGKEASMYEEIEKARKVLEEISQDEEERKLAEQREIWRIDYNSDMYSAELRGEYEGRKATAKRMLEKGFSIETIEEITKLTKEEIERIK